MKYCYKCKNTLDLDSFFKCKTNKDGLNKICKNCSKIKQQSEKYKQSKRLYYIKNKNALSTYGKYYFRTPKGKYSTYKRDARKRVIIFNLTFEEFMSFWQKPCYYCGRVIDTIGLDRIHSEKPYEVENIVACCTECNMLKGRVSSKNFINLCKIIASRF